MNLGNERSTAAAKRLMVIAVALLGILATSAAAQYFEDPWPAPITSRDLNRWAARLDMSLEQLNGAYGLHDAYKERYFALSKEFSTTFIPLHDVLVFIPTRKPNANDLRRAIGMQRQVWNRIAAADDVFFASITEILTDEQQLLVPYLSLERERSRYLVETEVYRWLGDYRFSFAHIDSIIATLPLSAAERTEVEPILQRYAKQVTAVLRDMYLGSGTMREDWFDAIQHLEWQPFDQNRAEMDLQMFSAVNAAYREAHQHNLDSYHRLIDVQQRFFREVSNALQPETRFDFTLIYLNEHYVQHAQLTDERRNNLRTALRSIRGEDGATGDEAIQLRLVRESAYQPTLDAAEKALKDIDAREREYRPRAITPAYRDLDEPARDALSSIFDLTRQVLSDVDEALNPPTETPPAAAEQTPAARSPRTPDEVREYRLNQIRNGTGVHRGTLTPPAIRYGELELYAQLLELDKAQQETLRRVHDPYTDVYLAAVDSMPGDMRENYLGVSLRTVPGEQPQMGYPSLSVIERRREHDPRILSEILAEDEAIFAALERDICTPEQAERMWLVRLNRDFDVYARDHLNFGDPFPLEEDRINLVTFFAASDLVDHAIWQPVFSDHAPALHDALVTAFVEQRDAAYAYNAARKVDSPRPPVSREEVDRMLADSERECLEGHNANVAHLRIVRQVVDEIVTRVPESDRLALIDAWQREAFPAVVEPVAAFTGRINAAARRAESLPGSRQAQLQDIILNARQQLRSTNDAIIELNQTGAEIYRLELGYSDEQRIILERRKMLEFERDELIVRTDARLERLLQFD